MDLELMLERCLRDQWSLDDVQWNGPLQPMSEETERSIVQSFVDMAGIERIAAALFEEQARKAESPTLCRIFETFVEDELRHARAAERLARRFDVRKLKTYAERPALSKFAASFLDAIRYLPPDIANAYTMAGELILDVALLRSLDEAIDDSVTHAVMALVNRDESRHIAIDFHMFDHYSSSAYATRAAGDDRPAADRLLGALALCGVLRRARPFFREVFFEPMERVDPTGRRLREAIKRLQLVMRRPNARTRRFVRFIRALFTAYENPLVRAVAGPLIVSLVGVEPHLLRTLYTEAELRRASAMSIEEAAADALAAKHAA